MLGCQDFCGYYDWTFHYLRRNFGAPAVESFWREAIAKDSQSHYIAAGQEKLLRGLYDAWKHTGESEKCEWTVSIDEARNHLRMDMRDCPSKGFLIKNDLNSDEDYCDHCIGWIGPALDIIGAQVVAHEHNHCGQCWWQIRMTSTPSTEPKLPDDIRDDPRWQTGFIDRFERNRRVEADDALGEQLARVVPVLVVGDAGLTTQNPIASATRSNCIATDRGYLKFDSDLSQPTCILLGDTVSIIRKVAERWTNVAAEDRPLLAHAYFPTAEPISFPDHGLPRPLPILPVLIRKRLYAHHPHQPRPTNNALTILLAAALANKVLISGIDEREFEEILQHYAKYFASRDSKSVGTNAELQLL